jgi:hypothetical protein
MEVDAEIHGTDLGTEIHGAEIHGAEVVPRQVHVGVDCNIYTLI